MQTAVDSSIILDLLCGDVQAASAAEQLLSDCLSEGALIVSEIVIAEIRPALSDEDLRQFLNDWSIQLVPGSLDSALLAGAMFQSYLKRGGAKKRVAADFVIGAHAMIFASRLCARDRGYWRDYFKKLEVVGPSDSSSESE